MIRLELQGGLGNQLFIWAMAHHLSQHFKRHVRIVYPLSADTRIDRPCELEGLLKHCNHNISLTTSKHLSLATKFIDKLDSVRWLANIIKIERFGIVTEKVANSADINYVRAPKLVRGYFQNTKMVNSCTKQVHSELYSFLDSVQIPAKLQNNSPNVVAHIRRGDTRNIAKEFGVLSLRYYMKHLGVDKSAVICTDEQSNLEEFYQEFPFASIITPKDSNSWQTLKILSSAEKLVMANSTLSWWGAWMAVRRENTEIIFPIPWRPGETHTDDAIKLSNVVVADSIFD